MIMAKKTVFEPIWAFLDASSHLYKRVCPSVGRSVTRFFGQPKMRKIELEADGVSERRGGQRLDDTANFMWTNLLFHK